MNINYRFKKFTCSSLLALVTFGHINTAHSQSKAEALPQLDVTGVRDGGQGFLSPHKVLAGDELQNKLSGTLGATLANELGVAATGYGAGSSRPVIRGLDGARVQILQNGLSVGDQEIVAVYSVVSAIVAVGISPVTGGVTPAIAAVAIVVSVPGNIAVTTPELMEFVAEPVVPTTVN